MNEVVSWMEVRVEPNVCRRHCAFLFTCPPGQCYYLNVFKYVSVTEPHRLCPPLKPDFNLADSTSSMTSPHASKYRVVRTVHISFIARERSSIHPPFNHQRLLVVLELLERQPGDWINSLLEAGSMDLTLNSHLGMSSSFEPIFRLVLMTHYFSSYFKTFPSQIPQYNIIPLQLVHLPKALKWISISRRLTKSVSERVSK